MLDDVVLRSRLWRCQTRLGIAQTWHTVLLQVFRGTQVSIFALHFAPHFPVPYLMPVWRYACVCVGIQRGLGTHVSFVRSVALDSWTEKQIQQMRAGGNTRCIEFLKKQGINMSTETPIREKYDTTAAELYRQVLLARVEGRPEPTEITATTAASNSQPARPTAPVVDPSRLIGFGSTPLPEPEPEVNAIGIATGATIVVGAAIIWAVSSL